MFGFIKNIIYKKKIKKLEDKRKVYADKIIFSDIELEKIKTQSDFQYQKAIQHNVAMTMLLDDFFNEWIKKL